MTELMCSGCNNRMSGVGGTGSDWKNIRRWQESRAISGVVSVNSINLWRIELNFCNSPSYPLQDISADHFL